MGSLCSTVGLAVAVLLAPVPTGKPFVSKAGFSVVIPGTPVESEPAKGIHVLESAHDGVDYAVSVVTLGEEPGDDVWAFARENNEKQFNTKVVAQEALKLQGLPGRLYRLELPDASIRAWTFLDRPGLKIYHLLVIEPKGKPESPEVTTFLKSFQVTRPGGGLVRRPARPS